jgi:hypothetical protein
MAATVESDKPVERQTWRIQVSTTGARILCEAPKASYGFDRGAFASDPRIKEMRWERDAVGAVGRFHQKRNPGRS